MRLDTPDSSWQIRIEKIYRSGENLLVFSRLSQTELPAAQAITTVADTVEIAPEPDLPVRHYILGKSWNWGDTGNYTFIDSMDTFGSALLDAELIYSR